MRIVIDLQGAQSASRFRGIGRHVLGLAQAIVRNRGEHDVILVLNALFQDTIQPLRDIFQDLLPPANIRICEMVGPVNESNPENASRREISERLWTVFVSSLNPDVIWIPSLFEGYDDDCITGVIENINASVIVTIHDFIPLLNPQIYLEPNPSYEKFYRRKIAQLRKADRCLAVSAASAHEARTLFDVDEDWVVEIPNSYGSQFKPMTISSGEKTRLCQSLGIIKPFIMYVGAADFRKNLQRLIEAYTQLSMHLRNEYQLVIVGKLSTGEVLVLQESAKAVGIRNDELVITGYVDDEALVKLYNLCEFFVFPSWHEGFGLPLVEAMACGKAVIGANTSSVPDIIGRSDALFDPFDVISITQKLEQVLSNKDFQMSLSDHGLKQVKKFSWDESARLAIAFFERVKKRRKPQQSVDHLSTRRLKLAYVSPLPPAHTGIADYSAELLPFLAKYYDIELVTEQDSIDNRYYHAGYTIRSPEWLRNNFNKIDRVIYHFGNSFFHGHMLSLIEDAPGIVVLHDFFLSGMYSYLELRDIVPHVWTDALYHSHGYRAVRERYLENNESWVNLEYPTNLKILQYSMGMIVHSEYSRKLAQKWYGENFSCDWKVIPHLRTSLSDGDREKVRRSLGFHNADYLVCSFGMIAPTKLNDRLLNAWFASILTRDERAHLVFVGEDHRGLYGQELRDFIHKNNLGHRIRITDRVDEVVYRNYLMAADVAVQLRGLSRGETSGSILDCMNNGLPTITNANGSFAELPLDAVWLLPDQFSDSELVEALETLYQEEQRRHDLGKQAREIILSRHAPADCAEMYAQIIEHFYSASSSHPIALSRSIALGRGDSSASTEIRDIEHLAQVIAQNLPFRQGMRQLLVDISATYYNDLKTGIERVVRGLLVMLLQNAIPGYRVEPVYLSNEQGCWHYKYARQYTLTLLGCPANSLQDDVVEPHNGDLLLSLDLFPQMLIPAVASGLHSRWRALGVKVYSMVHDLLPINFPQVFPFGSSESFALWLKTISQFDGAVCVSRTVAADLSLWLEKNREEQTPRNYHITWSHHGADIENSAPCYGISDETADIFKLISQRPGFLMVSTIEPRKGYLQTIEAFNLLWAEEIDVNLIIVGKEGWKGLPDSDRRSIPEIIHRIRTHPELGKRLFWLEGISDEYLQKIYRASSCLVAASIGEGFGLPLIEAACHELPIIARDIPVFREVAGSHAYYFAGENSSSLAEAIKDWLSLYHEKKHPSSSAMPWLTWKQSAENILASLSIQVRS